MASERHVQFPLHPDWSDGERHPPPLDVPEPLPSRQWLLAEATALIAARPRVPFALFAMGLTRFSEVTATFGFDVGDQVRLQIGPRLELACGAGTCVARLDGDRLVLLVPGAGEGPAEFERVAELAVRSLEEPFFVGGVPVAVEAAVGVAVYPQHGTVPDQILGNASRALAAAQEQSTPLAIYDQSQQECSSGAPALLGRLREAIESGGLELHYQPLVELGSERLLGMEALVRWPGAGVSPAEFIPLAERTGLIRRLDDWVLQSAVQQVAAWSAEGSRRVVHVNLSAQSFQDEGLPCRIRELLRSYAVSPTQLGVEITETAMMTNPENAVRVCSELREMGISVALDDFGSGYSPLLYLQQLAVSSVKIDRAFIATVGDPDTAALVRAVIEMGHQLGLQMVAEGIEDAETANRLLELGCDIGQGYYFGRPASPGALRVSPLASRGAA